MKKHLLTIGILTLSFSLHGQHYETKNFDLKGPVSKVIELEYNTEEDYLNNKHNTVDTLVFRPDGSLIYNRRFRNNGELLVEEKVELNQFEDIKEYSKYQISLTFKQEKYEYDTLENFFWKSTYEDGILQRSYKTFKDSNNQICKVEIYNANNELVSSKDIDPSRNMDWNDSNQNAPKSKINQFENYYEKIVVDTEGVKQAYWKFDNDDNILIRTFFNDDGNIRNQSAYELDQYGNWTKETFEAENRYVISIRSIEYYSNK